MEFKKNIVKLKDLTGNMKGVYIDRVEVLETSEIFPKVINGEKTQLCMGKIIDETITEPINLSAWGYAANFLKDSKFIKLENCMSKIYNGNIEISTGRFGRIIKIKEEENANTN